MRRACGAVLLVLAAVAMVVALSSGLYVQPLVRSLPTTAGPDASPPDWVNTPTPRQLTMDVVIDPPSRLTVTYELRVPADDELVDAARTGNTDAAELGRYLAGGPGNTPITVEGPTADRSAILRFGFSGPVTTDVIQLGDGSLADNPASAQVDRRL